MTDETGEKPQTFAEAMHACRTFGMWHDDARLDAVVAAHDREVAELHKMMHEAVNEFRRNCDYENEKMAVIIAELKDALRRICTALGEYTDDPFVIYEQERNAIKIARTTLEKYKEAKEP